MSVQFSPTASTIFRDCCILLSHSCSLCIAISTALNYSLQLIAKHFLCTYLHSLLIFWKYFAVTWSGIENMKSSLRCPSPQRLRRDEFLPEQFSCQKFPHEYLISLKVSLRASITFDDPKAPIWIDDSKTEKSKQIKKNILWKWGSDPMILSPLIWTNLQFQVWKLFTSFFFFFFFEQLILMLLAFLHPYYCWMLLFCCSGPIHNDDSLVVISTWFKLFFPSLFAQKKKTKEKNDKSKVACAFFPEIQQANRAVEEIGKIKGFTAILFSLYR